MDDLEPESPAAVSARRIQMIKRAGLELGLSIAFALSIVWIADTGDGARGAPAILKFATVAVVLTLWWGWYVHAIRQLDEFQQRLRLLALAISLGVTLWLTTMWGIASMIFGLVDLPAALVAPLAAICLILVQPLVNGRYS